MPARKKVKQADAVMEAQLEVAPFANNMHQTEYTKMMHRYAELDQKEKRLKRKQITANFMLFVSVVLVIGCVIGTYFVCNTIQSLSL